MSGIFLNLKRNLISLGTLEKEGFTVKLKSGEVRVSNGYRVVLSGKRRDNFVYSLEKKQSCAGLAQKTGTYQPGETTGARKARVVWQEKSRHTTQGLIDYVHSDLWGPSQVESLGGKRYLLSIVDDYSKRVWVYILRFKHEAFGWLRS
ncbi:retrovirus-related pol polyprotein from transposon TNT 1-94 [Tanacetum coccineum]